MKQNGKLRGRPSRYRDYEAILETYKPRTMNKRPVYANNIGVFRGKSGDRVFVKIYFREQGISKELPLGKLSSWDWKSLEAKRDEMQGKADRGEPLKDNKSISFKDFAERWLKHAEVSHRSYQTTMYCLRKQLVPFFKSKLINQITVADINDWQSKRMREVKPSTVKRDKNTLNALLNAAMREGLIEKNPCKNSSRIKGIQARLRLWSEKEFRSVLKCSEFDPEFRDCILWAAYSAMRRGEILNMQWKDIIEIPNNEKKIHIPLSKSGKARQIPCNKQMLEVLERQKGRRNDAQGKIFSFSIKTFQRRMVRVQEEAAKLGIKDIRFHDLRSFNITHAMVSGNDPKSIIAITGHSDLQMLDKHYAMIVNKAVNKTSQSTGDAIEKFLS